LFISLDAIQNETYQENVLRFYSANPESRATHWAESVTPSSLLKYPPKTLNRIMCKRSDNHVFRKEKG
jgi:hypothetical protein